MPSSKSTPCTAPRSLSGRASGSSSTTTAASWSWRHSRQRVSPNSGARSSSSPPILTYGVASPPTSSGLTQPTPTSTSSSGTTRRSSYIRSPAGREVTTRLGFDPLTTRFGLVLSAPAAVLALYSTISASQPRPTAARSVVVASDLHMGEGREPSGAWSAYEDFRWAGEFVDFLNASDREGQSAVDLVLNGDTFELLQSTHGGCTESVVASGCTEAEATERLERVLAAHTTE